MNDVRPRWINGTRRWHYDCDVGITAAMYEIGKRLALSEFVVSLMPTWKWRQQMAFDYFVPKLNILIWDISPSDILSIDILTVGRFSYH